MIQNEYRAVFKGAAVCFDDPAMINVYLSRGWRVFDRNGQELTLYGIQKEALKLGKLTG